MERERWALLFAVCLDFMMIVQGNCPDELPVKIQGFCLGIQMERAKHQDAHDQCKKLHEKALFANPSRIPQELVREMMALIKPKLQDTYWVGLEMKDNTPGGSLGDRK